MDTVNLQCKLSYHRPTGLGKCRRRVTSGGHAVISLASDMHGDMIFLTP